MKISDIEGSYMDSYEADYTNGEDVFADAHNLDHCIKYLNQSLVTFGFPSGLNLYSSDPVSIAKTCNCIYAIMQQRQRDIEYRETANDTRQRLMSEMSRLEIKMERLSDQLSIKEREIQTMASKEQKLTAGFKTQLEKLQLEKDEFQRMLIATQQVRSQQNHELKKKEKEYVKLQERLNQVVMERKKECKSGLEVMNLLQKEGRQRGTWNAKKADGDFYKMIVDAYESKKQELVAENADLRALLRSMQGDMRDFWNTPNGTSWPGNITNGNVDSELPQTPLGGRTDVFDLPFHMARDQIEQSLRAKMSSVKERMMQLQQGHQGGPAGDSSVGELQLEEQFAEAPSLLDEQATLMTKHIPDSAENSGTLREPQLKVETKVCTREENTIGHEQYANTAASSDFCNERSELAMAQQKLAEEQDSWTSAVTSMTPAVRGNSRQGGVRDPPQFESYEEFEHWIARSAFGGRHDETLVLLQRTQTVAIGPAVSNDESRIPEIA